MWQENINTQVLLKRTFCVTRKHKHTSAAQADAMCAWQENIDTQVLLKRTLCVATQYKHTRAAGADSVCGNAA